jgi:asparagine synthase (glutamine-hydrolysing)
MLNSLEVRCPLLDADLVSYMATLPVHLKLRRRKTKYLLKRVIESKLPQGIANRPKHGFGVPVGRWLREELRELFGDAVLAPDAHVRQWLDTDILRKYWDEHADGGRDNTNELWSALVLELWLRDASTSPLCESRAVAAL